MNYHIISDTHLGHNKLVKDGMRPEGFEDKILNNVSRLNEDDIFICLGDVAFYKESYWHDHILNFCKCKRKWLVLGNHDKKSISWYLDRGWDFVGSKIVLDIYGYNILLTHIPIDESCNCDINVHGHLHGRKGITFWNSILVNIDETLAPVTLRKLVTNWQNKK